MWTSTAQHIHHRTLTQGGPAHFQSHIIMTYTCDFRLAPGRVFNRLRQKNKTYIYFIYFGIQIVFKSKGNNRIIVISHIFQYICMEALVIIDTIDYTSTIFHFSYLKK